MALHIAKFSDDVELQDMQRLTNLEFVCGVEARDVYSVALDAIQYANRYLEIYITEYLRLYDEISPDIRL